MSEEVWKDRDDNKDRPTLPLFARKGGDSPLAKDIMCYKGRDRAGRAEKKGHDHFGKRKGIATQRSA